MEVQDMNDTDRNIVNAVKQIKELYKQIGLLLEHADELMADRDWESYGNQCVGGSNSLKKPTEWLPSYVFRMYHKGKRVAFIAAILDDPKGRAEERLTQPLLSAGWYDYGKNRRVKGLLYGWTDSHLEFANRKDDGSIMTTEDPEWLETDKTKVVRFSSFAIRLVSIQNAPDLRDRVIQPLLNHITKTK
jgi:hypothetical protein